MNYLKVAHACQLTVDFNGQVIPLTEINLTTPKANIRIEDAEVGRLNLSLIKNHNGVLLLRALDEPHSHIVYCVNVRFLSAEVKSVSLPEQETMECCEHAYNH